MVVASHRAKLVGSVLRDSRILALLSQYRPTVVSTILVGLDTATSDIDIVCEYTDQAIYLDVLHSALKRFGSSTCKVTLDHVVARFDFASFPFEIYASNIPIEQQSAVIHFSVMKRLVKIGGSQFCQNIRSRKIQGLKTEPAIADLLSLKGDPYQAVTALSLVSESDLEKYVLATLNVEPLG